MSQKTYIIASCKNWHFRSYEIIKNEVEESWLWVNSPEALSKALKYKTTKLTALRMDADIDAGPVYVKKPLSLEGRAEDIYVSAGELSFDTIRDIIQNEPLPKPQEGDATTFKRRVPAQSQLPSRGSTGALYNHIRMLDAEGYPTAFLEYGNFGLDFSDAKIEDGQLHAKVAIRTLPFDKKAET